ncbi:serine proteinase inhibitor [Bodo saltans virus]|uniref:Serine proteinase inhibitor n=1 Tax=Bodo saltans virus TaxID=2024608 RepID=A0A2H4UUB9_9VIRU|nr:serine proteinase inhibitor [Bodo saltans virus]ATZ80464.1 serine proteinase inhibitor [Bodo saltans virus]
MMLSKQQKKINDMTFMKMDNHKSVIDRVSLERQFEDSRTTNSDDDDEQSSSGSYLKGEITGKKIDNSGIDRGMPMRAQYEIKKSSYDENKYLDFNLRNINTKNKKINVKYNDGGNGNEYSSFAEIGKPENSITVQTNPLFSIANGIEQSGSLMFKYVMERLQDKSFIINSIGLYFIFSVLYLSSENATHHELGKFFSYPQKKILLKCIQKIAGIISKTNNFKIKNLLIFDKNIPYNSQFCEIVDNIALFSRIDTNDQINESKKLNFIINKIMGTTMRNPIMPQNFDNLQIMLMSVINISPIWDIKFEKNVSAMFSGYVNDRKENYMVAYNQTALYFEDAEKQIIEITCDDGNMNFGLILHKKIQSFESNESIHSYLQNAKKVSINEIVIPLFTQDYKMRYNNILKNNGINSIFVQLTANELFPSSGQIHDVVQNIKISINNISSNKKHQSIPERSNRKFIADKPFMYYFRLTEIDTIIINGMFV